MKLIPKAICITVIALLLLISKIIFWSSWRDISKVDGVVNFYKFDKILIEPLLTENMSLELPLFLLYLVNSDPNNQESLNKRNAIRKTWGNCSQRMHELAMSPISQLSKNITFCKLVFYMAKSQNNVEIRQESVKYGDILFVDYQDHYRSITRKLLVAFRWSTKLNPKYILKSDDDVVIHDSELLNELVKRRNEEYFYGGYVWKGSVVRDEKHPHYVPNDLFPNEYFPPFCKGACYIMSGDLLNPLVNAVNFVTPFGVDDAYVGVLMRYINVHPVHLSSMIFIPHRKLLPILNYIPTCAFSNIFTVGNYLESDMITNLYETFKNVDKKKQNCFPELLFSVGVLTLVLVFMSYILLRVCKRLDIKLKL